MRKHVYAIRVPRRTNWLNISNSTAYTAVYYPTPLHLQKCFAYVGNSRVTSRIRKNRGGNTGPAHFPELKSSDVKQIVRLVEKFYD